jgi:hypothetical protein
VVVQDLGQRSGAGAARTEVAAIDPVASMRAIDNPQLAQEAEKVRVKLRAALAHI